MPVYRCHPPRASGAQRRPETNNLEDWIRKDPVYMTGRRWQPAQMC